MALIVEDGSGLNNSNSFTDVTTGDAYHAAHLHATTWNSADNTTKETALIMATRLLNTMVHWRGTIRYLAQALAWPRIGVTDREGRTLATDQVPNQVKYATAELARWLISTDRTAESSTSSFSHLQVGEIAVDFIPNASSPPVIPAAVSTLISDLVERIDEHSNSLAQLYLERN